MGMKVYINFIIKISIFYVCVFDVSKIKIYFFIKIEF